MYLTFQFVFLNMLKRPQRVARTAGALAGFQCLLLLRVHGRQRQPPDSL